MDRELQKCREAVLRLLDMMRSHHVDTSCLVAARKNYIDSGRGFILLGFNSVDEVVRVAARAQDLLPAEYMMYETNHTATGVRDLSTAVVEYDPQGQFCLLVRVCLDRILFVQFPALITPIDQGREIVEDSANYRDG